MVVGRRHGRLSVGRDRPAVPWGPHRSLLRRWAGVPAGRAQLRVDRRARAGAAPWAPADSRSAARRRSCAAGAPPAPGQRSASRDQGRSNSISSSAGQRPRARDPHPGRAEFDGLRRDRRADAPAQRARDRDTALRAARSLQRARPPLRAAWNGPCGALRGTARIGLADGSLPAWRGVDGRGPVVVPSGRGPGTGRPPSSFRAAEAQEREGLLLHRRDQTLLKGNALPRAPGADRWSDDRGRGDGPTGPTPTAIGSSRDPPRKASVSFGLIVPPAPAAP